MPTHDSRIDDLYQVPLGEFVAARTALAKTLSKADAQQVRKLPKPTLVPWAVNQVYWRARSLYDRVLKSGGQLRDAQLAALAGRKADVRAAADAHRAAIADAVREAEKIAAADGSHPAPDALTRTFEAVSLASKVPEPHGRLTKPLQPAGFEALAGVTVAAPAHVYAQAERKREKDKARAAEQEKARKKEEAAMRKREAEIKKAEAALERAKRKMAEAEAALRQTRDRR